MINEELIVFLLKGITDVLTDAADEFGSKGDVGSVIYALALFQTMTTKNFTEMGKIDMLTASFLCMMATDQGQKLASVDQFAAPTMPGGMA